MANINSLIQSIVDGIGEQISDLGPGVQERVSLDAVVTDVMNLQTMLQAQPGAAKTLVATILTSLQAIQAGFANGTKGRQDLGPVLGNLETLVPLLDTTENGPAKSMVTTIVVRISNLLNYRPDVQAILGDLEAIKNLRGGPADALAFHDFHVLQLAFKSVWVHAFDEKLRSTAEQLYQEATKLYEGAGVDFPETGAIDDILALKDFIGSVRGATSDIAPPIPLNVQQWFGDTIVPVWNQLSDGQRAVATTKADFIQNLIDTRNPEILSLEVQEIFDSMAQMAKQPEGSGGKIIKLLDELSQAMSERYAFDVFAPNSHNYGLLLTYRQEWTPQEYQAGDLRATIPLAPLESRKYTKKKNIRITRSQKEIERAVASSSLQTSATQRAESSIMQKTSTATNFSMTAEGSFNVGVGDIKATTAFATNQASESVTSKRDFRETTIKAAQEYRLERSLEVDTSSSFDSEETESGEISNPNNEITVTYLFYELQRRYKINEYLYRVRPVILVAQDVPAPHEIDEAWLIEYQWILSRVLLDDSLRGALEYLATGLAGDEIALEVVRAQWENLRKVSTQLEAQLNNQISIRNFYRDQTAMLTYQENQLKAADSNVGWMGKLAEETFGNFSGAAADSIAAKEKYAEALLQNVNDNIADLQHKLKEATDSYQVATAKYADALQRRFSRTVAIDQLRIHVKQNIIYYMQAIWAHEPVDERFFRLHRQQVACPSPPQDCGVQVTGARVESGRYEVRIQMSECPPVIDQSSTDLVDVADIDNLLGYKGNYMIFPLKQQCYLTTYMLQEFIAANYALKDPDPFAVWKAMGSVDAVAQSVGTQLAKLDRGSIDAQNLINLFADFVNETQGAIDEVIIPTGQLFIEALPGAHPLLEDFKLLHRAEDVRKVKAEVRYAELENLRLAARLVASQNDAKNPAMLEDPDIEKKIVVEGNAEVSTDG